MREAIARFWAKVDRQDGDACWLWLRWCTGKGYASARWQGRHVQAARIAWEVSEGQIPLGMVLRSRCHNRACVRPSHHFLSTPGRLPGRLRLAA